MEETFVILPNRRNCMQNNGKRIEKNNNRQKEVYYKTNPTFTTDGYFEDTMYFFSESIHINQQFPQK